MTECRVQLPQMPTARSFAAAFASLASQVKNHGDKPVKFRIDRTTRSLIVDVREEESDEFDKSGSEA